MVSSNLLCKKIALRSTAIFESGVEAPCYHSSRNIRLPKAFFQSAEVFAQKWQHRLPVATPCVIIDETRRVWMLGNSSAQHGAANGHSCLPQRPQRSLR
jgi:hypothetical protein